MLFCFLIEDMKRDIYIFSRGVRKAKEPVTIVAILMKEWL